MKIAIVGTDPAGLYLACLLKSRRPDCMVEIIDTGSPDRDAAPPHILTNPVKPELKLADAELGARIMAAASRTQGVVIKRDGEMVRTGGQAYAMIRAATLVTILRERASALGCRIETGSVAGRKPADLGDVVVIADGAESVTRATLADGFKPELRPSKTRLMVFSTDRSVAEPTPELSAPDCATMFAV